MHFDLYSPRWQSDVVALADEVFGTGYFSRPSEIAAEQGSVIIIGQEDDKRLLCFARGRVLPEGALRDHLEGFVPDIPAEIVDADKMGALGVIQAIAVSSESRRQGFGSKLVALLHDRLIGMGADKLIVTFKRGPNVPHVDGMMAKLGFEIWQRLPTYWRQRCDEGAFHCSDRQTSCTCEALLYRKTIF